MIKHTCVAARIGDGAKRGAANMSILARRAIKRPAQGGAGSKRLMLGCDPGAGQESARDCAFLTRAFTVASPETGARRRAEEGPLWGSDPGDAHGIGVVTTRPRSAPRSHPASGPLLHVAPIPAPRFGASPILAATPCGLARVLAHGFVTSPLLSRSKRRALLRALSQNRASASCVLPS